MLLDVGLEERPHRLRVEVGRDRGGAGVGRVIGVLRGIDVLRQGQVEVDAGGRLADGEACPLRDRDVAVDRRVPHRLTGRAVQQGQARGAVARLHRQEPLERGQVALGGQRPGRRGRVDRHGVEVPVRDDLARGGVVLVPGVGAALRGTDLAGDRVGVLEVGGEGGVAAVWQGGHHQIGFGPGGEPHGVGAAAEGERGPRRGEDAERLAAGGEPEVVGREGRPEGVAVGVVGRVGGRAGVAGGVHRQGRVQPVELEPGVRQAAPGRDVDRAAAGRLHPVVDGPVAVVEQGVAGEGGAGRADEHALLPGRPDVAAGRVGTDAGEAADRHAVRAVVELLRVGVHVAGEGRGQQVRPPVVGRHGGVGGRVDPVVAGVVGDVEQVADRVEHRDGRLGGVGTELALVRLDRLGGGQRRQVGVVEVDLARHDLDPHGLRAVGDLDPGVGRLRQGRDVGGRRQRLVAGPDRDVEGEDDGVGRLVVRVQGAEPGPGVERHLDLGRGPAAVQGPEGELVLAGQLRHHGVGERVAGGEAPHVGAAADRVGRRRDRRRAGREDRPARRRVEVGGRDPGGAGGRKVPRGAAVAARPGVDQAERVDVDVALDPRRVGVDDPQRVQAEAGERDLGRRRGVVIHAAGRRQVQRAHLRDGRDARRRVGVGGVDRELGDLGARVGVAEEHLILRGRVDRLRRGQRRGRVERGAVARSQDGVLEPLAALPVGRRQAGPAVGQVDPLARPERGGGVRVGARILLGVEPVVAGGLDPVGAGGLPAEVEVLRLDRGGPERREDRRRAAERGPRPGPAGRVGLLGPARLGRRGELDEVRVEPTGDVPDGHHLAAGGQGDGRGEVAEVAPAAAGGHGQVARRGRRGERAGPAGAERHAGGRAGGLRRGGPEVHHVGARLGDVDRVVQPVPGVEVADVVRPAGGRGRPLDADALVGAIGPGGVPGVADVVGDALAAVIEVLRLDHRRAVRGDGPGQAVDGERRGGREDQAGLQRLEHLPEPGAATLGEGTAVAAGGMGAQLLRPTQGCSSVSEGVRSVWHRRGGEPACTGRRGGLLNNRGRPTRGY